jgi:hypothetical protein
VTAGHLVARLQLALHGDKDLDHLHDARGSSSPRCSFSTLSSKRLIELDRFVDTASSSPRVRPGLVVDDGELPPQTADSSTEHLFGDLAAASDPSDPRRRS